MRVHLFTSWVPFERPFAAFSASTDTLRWPRFEPPCNPSPQTKTSLPRFRMQSARGSTPGRHALKITVGAQASPLTAPCPEDGKEHPVAGLLRVILSADLWSQDKPVHANCSISIGPAQPSTPRDSATPGCGSWFLTLLSSLALSPCTAGLMPWQPIPGSISGALVPAQPTPRTSTACLVPLPCATPTMTEIPQPSPLVSIMASSTQRCSLDLPSLCSAVFAPRRN